MTILLMKRFFKNDFMIKFFCLTIVLICLTSLFCACSNKNQNENSDAPKNEEVTKEQNTDEIAMDKDIYIVDMLEDKNGHVIQKTVFNAVTKHTYIYTFAYESNAWGVVCKNSGVVIITEDGTIISPDTVPEPPEIPVQ